MHFRNFLLVFLLLTTGPAVAQTNLYTGEALVADDSAEERQRGITAAFEQMLVKLTGRQTVLNHQGVPAMTRRASSMMQQYRYRLVDAVEPEALPQRYLRAQFDKAAVDRELRSLDLQPWNASRPRILVWLAWENQGQRSVVNTEAFPEVAQALNDAADRRGFPLRLPLFDLMDQQLGAAQIWSVDSDSIKQASSRYSQNAILVGRMQSKDDMQWSIAWTLLQADSSGKFVSRPADMNTALSSGVEQAIDRLGQQYAPVVSDAGLEVVHVRVLDVLDLADYARVMRLFEQQDAVADVALTRAEQQELYLKIRVRGDPATLRRALELSGELQQEQALVQVIGPGVDSAATVVPTTEVTATYRLR